MNAAELFEMAMNGDPDVLKFPESADLRVEDYEKLVNWTTPVHLFARRSVPQFTHYVKSVLARKDAATLEDAEKRTPLHELARNGCREVLKHPQVASVHDINGDTPLHLLARAGVSEALKHPKVATLGEKPGKKTGLTPLHMLGMAGVAEILAHPKVAAQINDRTRTPLHFLASSGCAAAAWHPKSATIRDDFGKTPLHELAKAGCTEALKHPDVRFVKDNDGKTPWQYFEDSLRWNNDAREVFEVAKREQKKFEYSLYQLPRKLLEERANKFGCRDSQAMLENVYGNRKATNQVHEEIEQ